MSAMNDANTKDLVIDHIVTIADALCGTESPAYGGGDMLRHALGRIADYLEDNPVATGDSLPKVTASDNGDVLLVSGGKWAKGTLNKELPTVTAENNGQVLTVVEGVWAAAAPATSK